MVQDRNPGRRTGCGTRVFRWGLTGRFIREAALVDAIAELGDRIYLKRAQGGYDGRGQIKLEGSDAGVAWRALGEQPCVAEQAFDLKSEISVMAARNPSGEVVVYPRLRIIMNSRFWCGARFPLLYPAELEGQAQELATSMARRLELEGLLAVEMFVTQGDGAVCE